MVLICVERAARTKRPTPGSTLSSLSLGCCTLRWRGSRSGTALPRSTSKFTTVRSSMLPSLRILNPSHADCAHTLPILFAFTTPGKFCFRAMSTFIKYITGMLPKPSVDVPMILDNDTKDPCVTASPASTQANSLATNGGPPQMTTSRSEPLMKTRRSMPTFTASPEQIPSTPAAGVSPSSTSDIPPVPPLPGPESKGKTRRTLSTKVTRASSFLRRRTAPSESDRPPVPSTPPPRANGRDLSEPDVAGPRWQFHKTSADPQHRRAGEQEVYDNGLVSSPFRSILSHLPILRAF